ncbi:MAG: TolC family protein [Vampirovibrionales bacterium]|nr:TolC family protein [Vampirovibrionales bacterium]
MLKPQISLIPGLAKPFFRLALTGFIVLFAGSSIDAKNVIERRIASHQKDVAATGSWVAQQTIASPQLNASGLLQGTVQFLETPPEPKWWLTLQDKHLARYIEQALVHNPDAQSVRLNIERLKKAVSIAKSGLWPRLDLGYNLMESWNLKSNTTNQFDTDLNDGFDYVTPSNNVSRFNVPLIFSLEPDIWGTTWLKSRAMKRTMQAAEQQSILTLQAIAAQVATAYLGLMQADALIAAQRAIIEQRQHLVSIAQSRFEAGRTSAESLRQEQQALAQNQAMLSQYEEQQALAIFTLSAWVGELPNHPDTLKHDHWMRAALLDWPIWSVVSVGNPAKLLLNHPAVSAAEKELQKANIDVAVAQRAFLPMVSFKSAFVFNGFNIQNFSDTKSLLATLSASVIQPLFQGGKKRAQLSISKQSAEIALLNYYKALIQSAKSVNQSMASLSDSHLSWQFQEEAVSRVKQKQQITQAQADSGKIARSQCHQAALETLNQSKMTLQSRQVVLFNQIQLATNLGARF